MSASTVWTSNSTAASCKVFAIDARSHPLRARAPMFGLGTLKSGVRSAVDASLISSGRRNSARRVAQARPAIAQRKTTSRSSCQSRCGESRVSQRRWEFASVCRCDHPVCVCIRRRASPLRPHLFHDSAAELKSLALGRIDRRRLTASWHPPACAQYRTLRHPLEAKPCPVNSRSGRTQIGQRVLSSSR